MRRAPATADSLSMTASAAAVASVRDVSKTFGARKALNGVSVEVGAGEMVALIGPSGSGKSTLLRSITGLQTIDPGKGVIEVFGQTVQKNGRITGQVRAARQKLGMIFQQFNLIPSLTVSANLAFQARLAKRHDSARMSALAAALGLSDLLDRYPEQLSGGQQQRVAIGRALAGEPPLVLADEPTGNLDEATADKVLAEFLALVRGEGSAALVATHNERLAAKMDRVVRLHEGVLE